MNQQIVRMLRSLLLDLISEARGVTQSQLDALSDAQWSVLLKMARQHRLGPLMHWQSLHGKSVLRLPQGVSEALAQDFSQSALLNLQVQRELVMTCRLLAKADFFPVALKGACLAWWAYPHAALRPMRDLDLLVPLKDALQAYQVLLGGGLSRIQKYGYAGDVDTVMDHHHHLPPLRSATAALNIELHTRIFHVDEEDRAHEDLTDDPCFWSRCVVKELGRQRILLESPSDLLLHLIVHSVYDHEFSNGPLVLSDLAFLLRTHQIDWSLFWTTAERLGYKAGCSLMLQLAQHYWGDLGIEWHGHASGYSQGQLGELALLMLRDFDQRGELMLQAAFIERKSGKDKVLYLLQKIFPSRERMASLFAVRPDDWKIFLYYPVRWGMVAIKRLSLVGKPHNADTFSLDLDLLHQLRKQL